MDLLALKRDAVRVNQTLKTLDDGSVITTTGCRLHVPAKYFEKGLGAFGDETFVLGVFALQSGDAYAVSKITTLVEITPTGSSRYTQGKLEYIEFYFAPNSVVFPTRKVIVRDTITYEIFDFFIASGYVPWYFTPFDLGNLYGRAGVYNKVRLGADRTVIQLMAAVMTRVAGNKKQYWRHTLETPADLEKRNYEFVPFSSVLYSATSTISRLMGAYYDEGLIGALVNPSERVEGTEKLLRL
jgi:hypothetical protein